MNQFLEQEREVVFKRDCSGLLFLRETWVPAPTLAAPECPTFGSELVGHSTGGDWVRAWFLLRPRGTYLDGCEWPAIPDLDRRPVALVDPRSIKAGAPSAIVHVGGEVTKTIIKRERKLAAVSNAYWDAYPHPRREVATSAPKRPWWKFWSKE